MKEKEELTGKEELVEEKSSGKKLKLTEKIKESGYWGKIDESIFIVQPREYGKVFNKDTGEFGNGMKSDAVIYQDGKQVKMFSGLTNKQEFQLKVAGVIE